MAWFGKVIGGAFGFFVGGPLGALLGVALGSQFDVDEKREYTDYQSDSFSAKEREQATFFISTFTLLGKIVHADGELSQSEINAFRNMIQNEFQLGSKESQLAYNLFINSVNNQYRYEELLQQFYSIFRTNRDMLLLQLDLMVRLAVADNNFHEHEKQMIQQARTAFQVSDSDYEEILKRYTVDTLERYYAVLGCTALDSPDTIKAKYRKLVLEYHPDKVIAKGLPEEFVQFANKKFQEIQNAYEIIKKERGL